jgi:hypothetical protein
MMLSLLLAAAFAAPAAAHAWPDCLHAGPKKAPIGSFKELRACQKKVARRAEAAAEAKGRPFSDAERDSLADHQHEEARKFMTRSDAVVEGPKGGVSETARVPEDRDEQRGRDADDPPEMRAAGAHVEERLRSAGLDSLPPDAIERLKGLLKSNGGRVTPAFDRMLDKEIAAARGN